MSTHDSLQRLQNDLQALAGLHQGEELWNALTRTRAEFDRAVSALTQEASETVAQGSPASLKQSASQQRETLRVLQRVLSLGRILPDEEIDGPLAEWLRTNQGEMLSLEMLADFRDVVENHRKSADDLRAENARQLDELKNFRARFELFDTMGKLLDALAGVTTS